MTAALVAAKVNVDRPHIEVIMNEFYVYTPEEYIDALKRPGMSLIFLAKDIDLEEVNKLILSHNEEAQRLYDSSSRIS